MTEITSLRAERQARILIYVLLISSLKKMASTWKINLTVVYLSVLFVLSNAESKQITTVCDISYILVNSYCLSDKFTCSSNVTKVYQITLV